MKEYIPAPADTSDVVLPPELEALAEEIAKNVHEVWAATRRAEGWTLGPRDDAARTTPCLVPYEQLPEEERDYDRRTSQETLRYIMKLGFRISRD